MIKNSFFSLCLLLLIGKSYCQNILTDEKEKYIANNSLSLNDTNDIKLVHSKFYIMGEIHSLKHSFPVQMGLLIRLVKENKVNTLLMELPASQGYFIKRYLRIKNNHAFYSCGGRVIRYSAARPNNKKSREISRPS